MFILLWFAPTFFWLCEEELFEFSISVLTAPFCYIWHSLATKWKYLRSDFWGFNPGVEEIALLETSKYAFFSKYCVERNAELNVSIVLLITWTVLCVFKCVARIGKASQAYNVLLEEP